MKFLIVSRPLSGPGPVRLSPGQAMAAKTWLTELMSRGVVEWAFALEGGGSAYVVNAPSQGDITRAIREHHLSLYSEVEILSLREFDWQRLAVRDGEQSGDLS
jgi:hypothetical protein